MSLFLILLFGAGCTSVKSGYKNYQQYRSGEYREVLKRWTAKSQVYRGFETMYLVTGTYRSAAFRRAYVSKYARAYHLDSAAAKKMLTDDLGMAEENFEFILAVYAAEKDKVKLESRESLWRVYLEVEGLKRQHPVEIRNLKKERTRLKEFFPYITPWVEVYRIRFKNVPLPESATSIHLVQTGVLGTARLIFSIEN
ncbi:MAG: hypothetical protein JRJ73_03515 [Deltaproteobacteria bacterium]|nr:hypothetical protein [Deltaproteobacteria bacterium]